MNFATLLSESLPYLTHYGLVIIFVGGIMESETILLLAGVLCHRELLSIEWVIVLAILGAFAGDQFWFYIGYRYGNKALSRFPRLAKQADRIRPWLNRESDLIAFGSRFVFGSHTVAPMLLGTNKYSPIRFALLNLLSGITWVAVIFGAGYLLGASAEHFMGWVEHIELLLLIIILLMAIRWWYRHKNLIKISNVAEIRNKN